MKAHNLLPAILATFVCALTPYDDAEAAAAAGGAKGGSTASAGKSAGAGSAGARGTGAAARPSVPAGRLSLSARMNGAAARNHTATHEPTPHIYGAYGGGYHYQPNYYFFYSGGTSSHTTTPASVPTQMPSASAPSVSASPTAEPDIKETFKVMEQKGQIKKSFFKCLPNDGETWAAFKERCQAPEKSDEKTRDSLATFINTGCATTAQESAKMFLHRCTSIPR